MSTSDEEAMAFLNFARQYQKAAARLLADVEHEPKLGSQVPLSDPIYFLFFQTVELALKAFLRFRREEVPTKGPRGHDIAELHRRCHILGLRLNADPNELQNIVSLLASGHEDQGFRYFNLNSGGAIPDLPWTRDVVNSLIQVVRGLLGDNVPPGSAVKLQFIVGKPRDQAK